MTSKISLFVVQQHNNKHNNNTVLYPFLLAKIPEKYVIKGYFRREGKMNDSVVALPVQKSRLRLYCLRLTDKILILGNGEVKRSRTYEEDDTLQGFVMDLQKFERLLKQEVRAGNVEITEKEILTDKTFDV